MERHRADLLDFMFELAERSALHLEREDASAAEWEAADRFARSCVRGAGAQPEPALRDLAEHHQCVRHALDLFGAEVVEVTRREEAA